MDERISLALIFGSARQGRFLDVVATWVQSHLAEHPVFDVTVIDPATLDLPWGLEGTSDEPVTALKARVAAAEAYLVITPEYNRGYPAALKYMIDLAYGEWMAKPVAFVSYGGVSGGLRAVEQLRTVFAEVHATTLRDSVSISNPWGRFSEDGQPPEAELARKGMNIMLEQLSWWAFALNNARHAMPYPWATK